ncbi:MAG: helix-turn-helix domain-containing protein [Promethearchaeota archaeon]
MINVNKIIEDIKKGENQEIEFKETYTWNVETNRKDRSLKKEVVKAVCALGNSKGGRIYIGVADNKDIKGVQRDLNTYNATNRYNAKDKMIQDIKRKLSTDLGPKINDLTELSFNLVKGKELLLIMVNQSKEPLFISDKHFHYREESSSPKFTNLYVFYDYLKTHFNLIEGFKKETYEILKDLDPLDERIPIIQKILKKLIYDYYYGGVFNNNYDGKISGKILKLIRILSKFDPSYLPRYTGDNGTSVDHRRIISEFYHIQINEFKENIKKRIISPEKINRDINILSGDIAYEIKYLKDNSDKYKNIISNLNYLVNDKYENNPYFIEQYNSDKFLEAFEILREYGLIIVSEKEISISKDIYWKVPDKLRLDSYIRWKSINYLLFREEI